MLTVSSNNFVDANLSILWHREALLNARGSRLVSESPISLESEIFRQASQPAVVPTGNEHTVFLFLHFGRKDHGLN